YQRHYKTILQANYCGMDQDKVIVLYGCCLEELIKQNPTLNSLCIYVEVQEKEYQDKQPHRDGFPITVRLVLDVLMEEL
ncbi:MAG: hypothetical protein PF447_07960, partial [Spirochaetaceae bacterium]|nr:hypothetical protein [Spirochaetaceae bacterium]